MSKRVLIDAFSVLVFGFIAYSVVRIITTTAPDFAVYYNAARFTGSFSSVSHMLPPPSVLTYMAVGFLPYQLSQALWIVLSALLVPLTAALLFRMLGDKSLVHVALVSALAFLSFPVRFTLGMGQVNLIALFFLVSAIYKETKGRSFSGGSMMTFAILLKPELFLIIPVFMTAKRWRFVCTSVGFLIAASTVALAIWGVAGYQSYLGRMASTLGLLSGRAVYYNQALSGLIARFGTGPWFERAYIGLTAVMLGISVWILTRKRIRFPEIVWVSLPIFIILEPIAWQHHLVFLLPTYMWVWKKIHKVHNTRWYMIMAISYLLVSGNIKDPGRVSGFFAPFILSHGLIGTAALLGLSLRAL